MGHPRYREEQKKKKKGWATRPEACLRTGGPPSPPFLPPGLPPETPNPPYRGDPPTPGSVDPRIAACAAVAENGTSVILDAFGAAIPGGGVGKVIYDEGTTLRSEHAGDRTGTALGAAGVIADVGEMFKMTPVIGQAISLVSVGVDSFKFGYNTAACWF